MANFKPNYELEQRIVSDLMNDPSLVETYTLKTDWFNILNFKAMFISISKYPEVQEYAEWLGEAKNQGFQGEFNDAKKIHDDCFTTSDFKRLVTTLKREYLDNKFNAEAQTAKENPTTENQSNLVDTLSSIKNINTENHDGELNDATDEIVDSLYHPEPLGVQVYDYPKFNDVFGGGMNAGLHIIGANTGVGKTAFIINMIKKIMKDPTVHIDLYSSEMSARENEARLISSITGVSQYTLKDPYHRIRKDSIRSYVEQTAKAIRDSNLRIYDQSNDLSTIMDRMKSNASMMKQGQYKYVAFIDYIGLINVEDVDQRYLALGKITRELKNFSNDYCAPIIALTQLNRNIEQREDKHPKLSDIRESGNISQDASSVFFASESPDSTDKTTILDLDVAKNRNGSLSRIQYAFDKSHMQIAEVDK